MKVLKVFEIGLFVAFGIVLILFLNAIYKAKNICGYSIAIVCGISMYPKIEDGDILIVKHNDNYVNGNVICFKDENKIIVHRIININDDKILTKGDYNKIPDKPITKNQIIGKVICKSIILTFVYNNLHIVLICLIVFVVYKLKKTYKYDKIKP